MLANETERMPPTSNVDRTEQTFDRSLGKAVLGALLSDVLAAFAFMCLLAGEWVLGMSLSFVAVPLVISAARGLRRARQGGLDVTARGLRDRSLPYGWIAWSDVTRLSWNALMSTITLQLNSTPTASKRLNTEEPGAEARLPKRIVIHTATLSISRLDLVQLIERRAPLRVRPSESLYLGEP